MRRSSPNDRVSTYLDIQLEALVPRDEVAAVHLGQPGEARTYLMTPCLAG